jgi:hypothetical protein
VGELIKIFKNINLKFRLLISSDKVKTLQAPLHLHDLIFSTRNVFNFLSSKTATKTHSVCPVNMGLPMFSYKELAF